MRTVHKSCPRRPENFPRRWQMWSPCRIHPRIHAGRTYSRPYSPHLSLQRSCTSIFKSKPIFEWFFTTHWLAHFHDNIQSNSLTMFIDHHSATLYALVFGAELVPILTLARSAGAGTQRREFFLSKVVTDGKRIYDC
ncbi:hypothetical protein K443DRAFT_162402 [Laccaria amethystina LaAM-08-1]|uniref:Uncharacterized protein n=1 Tax=Laccaria amethystina LaAM-08-1 TaxID=1095629 RepID=A0A0C9WP61_9AGAR|nr:hypothetical protein K443DRAFT_162402 [Laccaria amethystina LaAM-08-1]